MSLTTRLREAALIGHTRPELSDLAQLLVEAAAQFEETEAAMDAMSASLDQSLAQLQPMVELANQWEAQFGDGTKLMEKLAELKDNAGRFAWLRDHATVQWQLDYEHVEVVFPMDAEEFTDLSDAVDLARGPA